MNTDRAAELFARIMRAWPSPAWDEHRSEAYLSLFDAKTADPDYIELYYLERAVNEAIGSEPAAFPPQPQELLVAAARIKQTDRAAARELDRGELRDRFESMPSAWPTGKPCPRSGCTGVLWLNVQPYVAARDGASVYLACRTCRSLVVMERAAYPENAQAGNYFRVSERTQMHDTERVTTKTQPPHQVDWNGVHPGRVIGAWLRAGGTKGEFDELPKEERYAKVMEQLAERAATMDAAEPSVGDMALDSLRAELKRAVATGDGESEWAQILRSEIQERHVAARDASTPRSEREMRHAGDGLAGMFEGMARSTPAPPVLPPDIEPDDGLNITPRGDA